MIREKLLITPTSPGCYLMKNSNNKIIYVGKAKNLKNRLSSYFNGTHTGKTKKLVSEITDFEYIVTKTENESFILELNLIKKYDPRYNILYTDDKTYPYIELTNEKYPRLIVVRNPKINRVKHPYIYGPFPNVTAARNTVNLLNRIYPLRKCVHLKDSPCLYYHIKECLGYCVYDIDVNIIEEYKDNIIKFLNGNYITIKKILEEKMSIYSDKLLYEKAKECKDTLDFIKTTLEKQSVESKITVATDVFTYYINNGFISIQIFHIRNGKLIERNSEVFSLVDDGVDEFVSFILSFYESNTIKPKQILVPSVVGLEYIDSLRTLLEIKVIAPIKGSNNQLIQMGINNAKISLEEKFELIQKDEVKTTQANEQLGVLLNINNLSRIEIFDNSHLFGSYSVSGMVTFIDGKPQKKLYRKYKITNEKNNEYDNMKEVIYRRYYRLLMEDGIFPDLILVDGSIGQINVTLEVLNQLNLDIKVFGLAKDDKHNTSVLVDQYHNKYDIDKTSALFHLLTRMQNEVHNYAINFHKQLRSKGSVESILDNVEGIGLKRKKALIKAFKSITKMKEATLEELNEYLPNNIAVKLKEYLTNNSL